MGLTTLPAETTARHTQADTNASDVYETAKPAVGSGHTLGEDRIREENREAREAAAAQEAKKAEDEAKEAERVPEEVKPSVAAEETEETKAQTDEVAKVEALGVHTEAKEQTKHAEEERKTEREREEEEEAKEQQKAKQEEEEEKHTTIIHEEASALLGPQISKQTERALLQSCDISIVNKPHPPTLPKPTISTSTASSNTTKPFSHTQDQQRAEEARISMPPVRPKQQQQDRCCIICVFVLLISLGVAGAIAGIILLFADTGEDTRKTMALSVPAIFTLLLGAG